MADTLRPDVLHAVVRQIADNVAELTRIRGQQLSTVAKMIRACHAAIARKPGAFDDYATRRHIAAERDKALLHLLALATQLENESARLSDNK